MDTTALLLRRLPRTAFSVPHPGYHGHRLADLDRLDAVGNVVTLGATLVLALLLLVPARKEAQR